MKYLPFAPFHTQQLRVNIVPLHQTLVFHIRIPSLHVINDDNMIIFLLFFMGTEYRLWAVFFHHGNSMRKYGYLISYLLHGRLNPNQRTNHSPIPQCKVGWLSVMHIFQTWTVFQKSNEILTRPPLTSTNLHRYNSICVYKCIVPPIYMSVPSTILTNTSRKRICILISILLRMLKRNNKIPFLRVKSLVISHLASKHQFKFVKSCQMIKKYYKPLE